MKIENRHKCPYCGFAYQAVFGQNTFASFLYDPEWTVAVHAVLFVCPHLDCRKIEVFVDAGAFPNNLKGKSEEEMRKMRFDLPSPFFRQRILPYAYGGKSDFRTSEIPEAIYRDYDEACKLVRVSPCASATYARRCIQRMIRHKFKIKPGKLQNEIAALGALSTPVRQEIIEVLDCVRRMGKLGALPEDDVKVVVDIAPDEAQQILDIIEILMHIWYLSPAEQNKRLDALQSIVRKRCPE